MAALWLGPVLCLSGFGAGADPHPAAGDPTTALSLLESATPAREHFSVSTGFRLTQNTIQVDALPEGAVSASSFIVDSGAPMTVAPPLVRDLGLTAEASIALAGPEGGHLEVPVVRLPGMSIAGLAFRDVGAVVDWVEPPDPLACLSTAGLLGASLLQAAIWQIDFETQRITVTDSLSTLPGLQHAMRIPFERSDAAGSPRIRVGVSGIDNLSLLVDLGFNGAIAIPAALLAQAGHRIADSDPTEVGQTSTTVFGHRQSEVRITRVRELRLGDLALADFPVITGSTVSDFHVGIEFLRHFRVTLDWLNDTLYLEPRGPRSALYDDFAAYGFSPSLQSGELVVSAIWLGGSADTAGLGLGDRLVEIDGRDTSAPDFQSLCSLLDGTDLFGSGDAPITVTRLRDGKRETLRVARSPLLTDPSKTGSDSRAAAPRPE